MFGSMFKSTPARGAEAGSRADEEVVAGAEVSDETARRLLEELDSNEETTRSPPASHSTPRTSPHSVQEPPEAQQGYQQPDDPLGIRGGGGVVDRRSIEPVVVDHSACMSAGQRAETYHEELESKMDELLRRQEELHVRFAAATSIIDYDNGSATRPVTPLKRVMVPTPYPSRTPSRCAEEKEFARAEGARRYQSFLDDFSLTNNTAASKPDIHCVIKPRKFDGKNWPGYRLHFMSCAQANGWAASQSAMVLKACLNEETALNLRRNLRCKDASLEEIFQCLDEIHCAPGPEFVLRGKLRRLMQRPDQSVHSYQVELKALLAHQADPEESAGAVEQFIFGLNDPYMQKYVAKRCPADLHDALQYARSYEEMNSWLQGGHKKTSKRVSAVTATSDRPAIAAADDVNDAAEPTDELTALREELGVLRSKMKYWRDQCKRGGGGRGRGRGRGRGYGGNREAGDQEQDVSQQAGPSAAPPPAVAVSAVTAAPAAQN